MPDLRFQSVWFWFTINSEIHRKKRHATHIQHIVKFHPRSPEDLLESQGDDCLIAYLMYLKNIFFSLFLFYMEKSVAKIKARDLKVTAALFLLLKLFYLDLLCDSHSSLGVRTEWKPALLPPDPQDSHCPRIPSSLLETLGDSEARKASQERSLSSPVTQKNQDTNERIPAAQAPAETTQPLEVPDSTEL